ncbi:MAG TPA: hypothetical protein VKB26_09265 [Candidatus Acidoferrales bacterium]|nr:hypothetical protein [Candidatus Acidoferrales bacterium]
MTDVNLGTLIFFVSALSCIILANYLSYRILQQVNSGLPGNKKTGPFWILLDKELEKDAKKDPRIARRGRRIYLAGIRHVGWRGLLYLTIASALACAWELGFFYTK